jgi:ABC-2 type transport system permease protein
MSRHARATPLGQVVATLRFGVREFFVFQPPHIIVTTMLPRAVLQCLFFAVLGGALGGAAGRQFATVGGLAGILPLAATVAVADVLAHDKWSGTFSRVRTATRHPFVIYLARCAPYPVQAMAMVLVALLIVPPIVGSTALIPDLLPRLPLYLLMALTTAAAGMAGAAVAVGRRADVLVGNLLQYLILLAGGVFLPPGRVAWVDAIGVVVPVRHGLAAVHASLAGRPWLQPALMEVAVGVGWLALAFVIVDVQARRARRLGHDDFT